MFFFNIVQLTVAAVAGNDDHVRTCGLDLIHFSPAVVYAFFVVAGCQCSASTSAADLIHPERVKINPVFQTLIKYPPGFVKEPMSKPLLGLSTIVARIMVGGQDIEP